MPDHLKLFREYAELDRKRSGAGVTPLEFQRWLDLDGRLGARFRGRGAEPRESPGSRTRLRVDFRTPDQFRAAYISELSRGGMFVATPFAPEIGTELVLRIHIHTTQQDLELSGVVATNNVSDGFSTDLLGMGVHFVSLTPEQRLALDKLLACSESAARSA